MPCPPPPPHTPCSQNYQLLVQFSSHAFTSWMDFVSWQGVQIDTSQVARGTGCCAIGYNVVDRLGVSVTYKTGCTTDSLRGQTFGTGKTYCRQKDPYVCHKGILDGPTCSPADTKPCTTVDWTSFCGNLNGQPPDGLNFSASAFYKSSFRHAC